MSSRKHHHRDAVEPATSSLLEHSIDRFKGFQAPPQNEKDSAVRAGAHALLFLKALSGKKSHHQTSSPTQHQQQHLPSLSSTHQQHKSSAPAAHQPHFHASASSGSLPLSAALNHQSVQHTHRSSSSLKLQHEKKLIQEPNPAAAGSAGAGTPSTAPSSTGSAATTQQQQLTSYKALTPEEKKALRRRQNTQSARQTRQKYRLRMEMMRKEYEANEERIKHLTKLASDLTKELDTQGKKTPHSNSNSNNDINIRANCNNNTAKREDVPVHVMTTNHLSHNPNSRKSSRLEGPTF